MLPELSEKLLVDGALSLVMAMHAVKFVVVELADLSIKIRALRALLAVPAVPASYFAA